MTKVTKQILRTVLILLAGCLFGWLLLALSYLIPQEWMTKHFLESQMSFEQEEE